MSEIKWIKIATNMFDNRKIRQIEALPDGDAIIVIWVKLLCLAGNLNEQGYLYFTQEVPYTEEMMAVQFNRPIATIRLALTTFEKFGMVAIIDDLIKISNWEEYQNIDGMERIREQNRIRQQRKREKDKRVLLTEHRKCVYCGGEGNTVDHVIPKSKGGDESPDNTVYCCLQCNMEKTNDTVENFLNRRLMLNKPVDIQGILQNKILSQMVVFDYQRNRFERRAATQCHVTSHQCHAAEEDIEEDKDINNKYTCAFSEFWKNYPRKKEKSKAYKCYKARLNDGYTEDQLLAACINYAAECEHNKTEERYIKHGATFLSANEPFLDYLKGEEHGTMGNDTGTNKDRELEELARRLLDEERRSGMSTV